MAVKGSGTAPRNNNPDPPMVEQTHYDARSGSAKRTQTAFPVKDGMKDMTTMSRVGPGMAAGGAPNPAYHFGPDASSANPSDPETPAQRGKVLRRQPGAFVNADGDYQPGKLQSTWGMKGGMGQDVDNNIGGQVLGEAILSGASALPAATAPAKGPAPAYSGKDPN